MKEAIRVVFPQRNTVELSEFEPGDPLAGEIVIETEGRLIAACFASHIHRVQQIVDAAVDAGRTIAFLGRSMERNVPIAQELGLIDVPADSVVSIRDVLDLPPEDTAVICTGAQGEPLAALSRMAGGDHRWVKVEEGDTVLISARPIPGNESKVNRVINSLTKRGVRVYHGDNANVHVSGHGAQEELKTFINVIRPQAFVPVHGEHRHLKAHALLAEQMGVPEIVLCEDGDAVVLNDGGIAVKRKAVSSGYVFVDGLEVGETERGVIRDRRHLSEDGVIVVTIVVDRRTGEIVDGPDLESHGFMEDPTEVFAKARDAVAGAVGGIQDWPTDFDALRRSIRSAVNKVTKKTNRRRAVVIPIILEV